MDAREEPGRGEGLELGRGEVLILFWGMCVEWAVATFYEILDCYVLGCLSGAAAEGAGVAGAKLI